MERLITIHYGELALKGQNRGQFEAIIIKNIKNALKDEKYSKLERNQLRLLLHLNGDSNLHNILVKLKEVFGIKWFSYAISCTKNLEEIKKIVLNQSKQYQNFSIKVNTVRADKNFPLNSMEISRQVGQVLFEAGFKIDVKNPQLKINIEILKDQVNIFFDKIAGLGGLPVGTSSKVLCLLSGGIDSPVAAWLMMKRGCNVDYLHIHPFANSEEAKKSKITEIIKKLDLFSQYSSKLFVSSYNEFYKKSFEFENKNELILFRRFILLLANEIAKKNGYLGIVTGDNLAQVASQTLQNIYATNEISELPVYRPVLTYDKEEIIALAKKIGTYEISIRPYRDCCSLVAAKHPSTRAKLEELKEIENKIDIKKIIEKTLKEVEKI